MTDLANVDTADTKSTVLDTNTAPDASGGGVPRTLEEPAESKTLSLREVVAEEAKKGSADEKPDADDAKGEAKEEKDAKAGKDETAEKADKDEKAEKAEKAKADRADDGKFKAKAGPEDGDDTNVNDRREDKTQSRIEPPKSFLPDAKETWRNTPRAVQRDVENLARTYEGQIETARKSAERYEALREYDDVARSNGRDLKDSLATMAQIEDSLQSNPIAALNRILIEAGPRKADGSPVSLFEVAKWVVSQGEQGYQKVVAAKPANDARQSGPSPEVAQLQQQIAQLEQQRVSDAVIAPFKASHPRYEELREDIAMFLKSGKVSSSLSPSDRLAAAYDMAVRINPASHDELPAAKADPDPDRRADRIDPSGNKSIKSAPGSVSPDLTPERGGSIADILRDESRRQRRG